VVATKDRTLVRTGARKTSVPVLCLDAGNGYFKLVTQDGAHVSFPAAVKKLKSYELGQVTPDSNSVVVRLGKTSYAFGSIAVQLGGRSLFEVGKAEHTPVAVAAAITLSRLGTQCPILKLRLLVPDASRTEWKAVAEALPDALKKFHALAYGDERELEYQPRIDDVQLVSEGFPVWSYAQKAGLIPASLANRELTGVIDVGTGDLTCSMWTRSGTLVREAGVSFATPAMQTLAGNIAASFASETAYTPSRSSILEIIRQQGEVRAEDRRYVYEMAGEAYDFTDILREEVRDWNSSLMFSLKNDRWATIWGQLGMVFITGGASDLLEPMERATKGRFKIVRLEHTQPQMVNAALMQLL
jgi:hypothetical protein